MRFLKICRLFALTLPALLPAQASDTIHFQWPNEPFNSSHFLNATFYEYRNTLSANHLSKQMTLHQTSRPAFTSTKLERSAAGISAIADGRSIRIK